MRLHFISMMIAKIKRTMRSVSKHVEKLEPLVITSGNVKWCSFFVKQFLKRLKIELTYDPAIPLLGIYPKEMDTYMYTKTRT
jgi:hypothetical protein